MNFKIRLSKSLFSSSLCFFFSFLLFLSLGSKNSINSVFEKSRDKEMPYFHTLIEGKANLQRIQRKLLSVPGIKAVRILKQEITNKKLNSVVKNLDDLGVSLDGVEGMNLSAVKIYLDTKVSDSKKSLIREYIQRLNPKNEIVFSGTKIEKGLNFDKVIHFYSSKAYWIVVGFISVSLGLLLILYFNSKGSIFYLRNKYQRKPNWLRAFTDLSFILLPFSLFIPLSIFNNYFELNYSHLISLFVLIAVSKIIIRVKTKNYA